MFSLGATALGLTTLITTTLAGHNHLNRAEHHALAQRAPGTVAKRDQFNGARFTFFDTGLGACGIVNQPSDFIVALNQGQYEQDNHCFKMITISANGKTAQAQITDECPGCPWGGLDMTTGLFDFFADPSVGIVYGSWHFNDGSGGGNVGGGDPTTSSSTPKPTPTSTKSPKPTSTYTPPSPPPSTTSTSSSSTTKKTTSTSSSTSSSSSTTSKPSTTTKSTSTSKSSSSSSSSSTQSTSTSATPNATQIAAIMQAALGMAALAAVGRA